MAFNDELLYEPKYQALVADEDLAKGEAVKLSSGKAAKVSAATDYLYGVCTRDVSEGEDVTIFKRGGSSEAVVKVGAASYAVGDKLALHTDGSFAKTTTANARFWAIAVEAKTTTSSNDLLKVELALGKV